MVARVRHHNMSVVCKGQSLRAVQRVRQRIHERQERPTRVKHLQQMLAGLDVEEVVIKVA